MAWPTTPPSVIRSQATSPAYAHAYPHTDARTRGRVKLRSTGPESVADDVFSPDDCSRPNGSPLPAAKPSDVEAVFRSFFAHSVDALSLFLLKRALDADGHSLGVVMLSAASVLLAAPLVSLVSATRAKSPPLAKRLFGPSKDDSARSANLSTGLVTALTLVVQPLSLLYALSQLSVIRTIILTSASLEWSHCLSSLLRLIAAQPSSLVRFAETPTYLLNLPYGAGLVVVCMMCTCLALDLHFNAVTPLDSNRLVAGYLALLAHLSAQGFQQSLTEYPGPQSTAQFNRTSQLLAAILALPLAISGAFITSLPLQAHSPLISFAVLYTFANQFLLPITDRGHKSLITSLLLSSSSTLFVGSTAFATGLGSLPDYFTTLVFYLGIANILPASLSASVTEGPSKMTPQGPMDKMAAGYRRTRAVVKTVLANTESRKISFFLCLNLAYMLVQMMYGIWTNSLGLISDSIHMFFDCMALAMGLFASVMSTWPPDDRFPYGYGRVETLSGYVNGIFLILISIFIVIEAVMRLLEPPEMNTNQLLVVSSLGLAVNLVGMFATGHHHHHHGGGHSHSHSHGHSHSHSDHHGHSHGHGHSHSHCHSPAHDHGHSNSPAHDQGHSHSSHEHGHSHSPAHDHGHSHPPAHDHGHSGSPTHSHGHSHSPPHNHDPHPLLHPHYHGHGHVHTYSPLHNDEPSHHHSPGPDHTHSYHHSSGPDHGTSPSRGHSSSDQPDPHSHESSLEHFPSRQKLEPKVTCSHGHSHNMKGVFLHVMADTLGSLGVMISTVLIERFGWTGFDPLASIFIAVLIFGSVVPLVADCGRVLVLDLGKDREAEVRVALLKLSTVEGLASYAAPKFWPKDSSKIIGSLHIQLEPTPSTLITEQRVDAPRYNRVENVKKKVEKVLKEYIRDLDELVVQIEGVDGVLGCGCLVRTSAPISGDHLVASTNSVKCSKGI